MTINFLKVSVLIIILSLSIGCATNSMRLDVLKPAEIDVPKDIEKVALANRSLPSNRNYRENIIEGIFTQEPVYADRDGSIQAVRGAAAKLNQSPRFTAVILEGLNLYGSGTRNFAPPLSWIQVEQICQTFNTDALILLEAFDSNIRIEKSKKQKKEKKDSVEIMVTEYTAKLFVDIDAGWRVYDMKSRQIIDHNNIHFGKTWTGTGKTPKKAIADLPPIRELISDAGLLSGELYAQHISPVWVTVSRNYYQKGSDKLKIAANFAKSGDWDSASEIWNDLSDSEDPKEAERASYNMILASEIDGDFQNALYWARVAIKKYNNKKAGDYIRIINNRIADSQRLDNQLNK